MNIYKRKAVYAEKGGEKRMRAFWGLIWAMKDELTSASVGKGGSN